ncbi:uncharacterized protein C6orf163-like [Stegostoma tigrinum]|uniref:uncharacterized protein C6orf163-like n=1 Tax=Stegostoma tigrinum TaxID=3053191 RepID=UPI00202B26F7|nr:uncharacterized protein C6orf163-like [Stegostoma tigrinum]
MSRAPDINIFKSTEPRDELFVCILDSIPFVRLDELVGRKLIPPSLFSFSLYLHVWSLMDTWCFNIASRKSLLVTPDRGVRGLPTWYKTPTHALVQLDAHKCILDLGAQIHKKYMNETVNEIRQAVEEVRATMLYWAKKEKEEAVKAALVEAENKKKAAIEVLKKTHMVEMNKAIRKTVAKMQWQQEQMVSKEHEVGKQRLAHEIQLMLHKCEIEKEKAVAEAIEKEKQLASHTLDQVITKLKTDAETQSQSILQETLEIQKAEYEEKIMMEVAKARVEEQAQAMEPILILQSRHQSEIDMLKRLLCEKEVDLKDVYNKVETMTILELELETELRNTRSAFQEYINLTYPNLAPGQADFILPPRQMCKDSLTTNKPQNAQKRPQEK